MERGCLAHEPDASAHGHVGGNRGTGSDRGQGVYRRAVHRGRTIANTPKSTLRTNTTPTPLSLNLCWRLPTSARADLSQSRLHQSQRIPMPAVNSSPPVRSEKHIRKRRSRNSERSSNLLIGFVAMAAAVSIALSWVIPDPHTARLFLIAPFALVIFAGYESLVRQRRRFRVLSRIAKLRDAEIKRLKGKVARNIEKKNRLREKVKSLGTRLTASCVAIGSAHEAREDWEAAIATWRLFIEAAPDNRTIRQRLADALEKAGDRTAAIAVREELRDSKPTDLPIRRSLASTYEADGAWRAAIAEREYVASQDPANAHNQLRLAGDLLAAGSRDRALAVLASAYSSRIVTTQMIRSGIEKAVETDDRDTLDLYVGALKADLANPVEAVPEPPSLPLWRSLVNLGEIDVALDYQRAPEAPSPAPEATGAPRAIVVDPAFNPLQGAGHHFNMNLLFRELLSAIGAHPSFHGQITGHSESSGFDFRPTTTIPMYGRDPRFADVDWFRNVNRYLEVELTRQLPHERVFVFHTMTGTTILGMARWLANAIGDRPAAIVVGIVDHEITASSPTGAAARTVYSEAFEILRRLKNKQMLIFAETDELTTILRQLGGEGFDIRQYPYVAASLALQYAGARTAAQAKGRLTVGYVGATRLERGSELIPDLVDALRDHDIDWLVQLDTERLAKIAVQENTRSLIEQMKDNPRVEIAPAGLAPADYYSVLDRIDILVLPYRERYQRTGSGVFVEALTLGKVQVLPDEGWMVDMLNELGGKPVTFGQPTVGEVRPAIEFAIRDFASLKAAAETAARTWNERKSGSASIEEWLRRRVRQ
ncbi:MAG: hypothetical protein KDJ88_11890 [Bauldia sp.]|nr:hypothetical protein [Bauldia sp.]